MRRTIMLFGVILMPSLILAQKTSKNNFTGNWSTNSTWSDNSAPSYTNVPSTNVNYDMYGYVNVGSYGSNVTMSFKNVNSAYNFTVYDTLVIYGDMTFANKAMNLVIPAGGLLIVLGNLSSTNKIDLNNGGTLVVSGTANFGGAQSDYNGSGNFWPIGGTSGNTDATTASNNSGNFDSNAPPSLINFINNNGQYPLPITLTSFSSVLKQNSIELNWSTSSEINFNYFSVQRSANGKDFNEITQVQGHGTTNEAHHYQYEDRLPFIGKNYYRLTSVDFDNYQETFKVIVQEFYGNREFSISPNPTDGRSIRLNFNFESTDGLLTVYNNIGYVVATYEITGAGDIDFESPLKSGIYLAKFSSGDFNKTVRFVVN